jgi:hypothetical protein
MTKHISLSSLNVDTPAPPCIITGRYLAHNKLGPRARARLVKDILDGRAVIDTGTLTIRQLVKLCRANSVYANEARFPERVKHRQQKKLEQIFNAIGPDARAEACRTIGIEAVWSALSAAL